jgi:hypothetical protein
VVPHPAWRRDHRDGRASPALARGAGLAKGDDLGQSAEQIATTLLSHPDLFATLPANLQTDLTTLKNAPAADLGTDAKKTEATALSGGYGQMIQKIAEGIQAHADVSAVASVFFASVPRSAAGAFFRVVRSV